MNRENRFFRICNHCEGHGIFYTTICERCDGTGMHPTDAGDEVIEFLGRIEMGMEHRKVAT